MVKDKIESVLHKNLNKSPTLNSTCWLNHQFKSIAQCNRHRQCFVPLCLSQFVHCHFILTCSSISCNCYLQFMAWQNSRKKSWTQKEFICVCQMVSSRNKEVMFFLQTVWTNSVAIKSRPALSQRDQFETEIWNFARTCSMLKTSSLLKEATLKVSALSQ